MLAARLRSPFLLATLAVVALTGCSCGDSHVRHDDAGSPTTDGLVLPDALCAPGSTDPACRRCSGPPPAPDCTCDTTTTPPSYVCGRECPAGIEPWNPDAPGNACAPDGRECSSGGSVCGAGMFCQCAGGRWSCAVAEPDPACYCGRAPDEGSPCTEEGMLCGSCCPTPGSPAFGPYTCTGGRWTINDCPSECPPIDEPPCPVEHVPGAPCAFEGQSCGDPCCGSIVCTGGAWAPGPELGCACRSDAVFDCGSGGCTLDRACASHCGPDDGIEHSCVALPPGCARCDCAPLDPGVTCEERDGHVFLREAGFCG